ncbi:hypothetical protein K7X08_016007 [Anisodus acutangulus]|uniref:Uncharacterized protein n=1 Tax=Anisodus acutangulus TaxID=402998 RepID=A0A9Q1LE15_9SOLA|nr:hypothetical protein K7X08_016007 [Anisodus acutangulus]
MVHVGLIFNHDGEWITKPYVLYSKKYVHLWRGYDSDLLSFKDLVDEFNEKLGFVGVQQLIIAGPSDKYYEIEDDVEIRQLLCLVSDKFSVINIYAVEECELAVTLPNIVHHTKTYAAVASAASDGSSSEGEEESDDGIDPDDFDYNSEKIGCFLAQRRY